MALDVGEDRKRKAGERIKRASCLPTPTLGLFGCAARSTCTLAPLAPLRPLAPPCPPPWPLPDPLQPLKTLTTRVQPLTTPNAPSRSLPPPYRPKALDCHALEQAIGEGKAAELPAEDLKAAEAVLEKARAAEKAKCEKDLRDKMKARSLTSPESPHYSAPRPLTTTPPVPLLPFRRRGRCWVSTSRASARRSHAPSRSGCPASYSSRPRPSCPKRRGRTSSRERARHLARSLARYLAEISRGQGTPVRAAWRAHARREAA